MSGKDTWRRDSNEETTIVRSDLKIKIDVAATGHIL